VWIMFCECNWNGFAKESDVWAQLWSVDVCDMEKKMDRNEIRN